MQLAPVEQEKVNAARRLSGLQVGESPTPFNPLHCNGKRAGNKDCLV